MSDLNVNSAHSFTEGATCGSSAPSIQPMNTTMSPLFVRILLHQYVHRGVPGYQPVLPDGMLMYSAQSDCLVRMRREGLLSGFFNGFLLTPKGVALVENILATPLPVERSQWVDPRFEK